MVTDPPDANSSNDIDAHPLSEIGDTCSTPSTWSNIQIKEEEDSVSDLTNKDSVSRAAPDEPSGYAKNLKLQIDITKYKINLTK